MLQTHLCIKIQHIRLPVAAVTAAAAAAASVAVSAAAAAAASSVSFTIDTINAAMLPQCRSIAR